MEKYITKNGIKYELRGEQYYSMLEISEQTKHEIGKYGHLYLDFIKKNRRGTYTTLLTEGRLNEYLHEIDLQAHAMLDDVIPRLAKERGKDEDLKAHNSLQWVAEMNNIKASAEEIVFNEVVYETRGICAYPDAFDGAIENEYLLHINTAIHYPISDPKLLRI